MEKGNYMGNDELAKELLGEGGGGGKEAGGGPQRGHQSKAMLDPGHPTWGCGTLSCCGTDKGVEGAEGIRAEG